MRLRPRGGRGLEAEMGLWVRIFSRYLVGALAGLLLYAGLPADVVAAIKNDPEVTAGVGLGIAALTEWATMIARRRGWMT